MAENPAPKGCYAGKKQKKAEVADKDDILFITKKDLAAAINTGSANHRIG